MLLVALCSGLSCKKTVKDDERNGFLAFRFDGNPRELSKVSQEMPDTNDFLITVTDEDGKTVFDGIYCDIPETMEVPPGSYGIYVRSEDFSGIAFSSPQYGDEQCVVVPPAGVMTVELGCRQINSGIRLDVSPGFLSEYPDGLTAGKIWRFRCEAGGSTGKEFSLRLEWYQDELFLEADLVPES